MAWLNKSCEKTQEHRAVLYTNHPFTKMCICGVLHAGNLLCECFWYYNHITWASFFHTLFPLYRTITKKKGADANMT